MATSLYSHFIVTLLSLYSHFILTLFSLPALQIGKGVMRILEGDVNKVADIIPIDYCVNMLLCIGWYTSIVK